MKSIRYMQLLFLRLAKKISYQKVFDLNYLSGQYAITLVQKIHITPALK